MAHTTLAAASARITEVLDRLRLAATEAQAYNESIASAQREVIRAKAALAAFQADDHDGVSANASGFAENVAHALDGIDRVLGESSRAALAVVAAPKQFGAQVASWREAAKD